MAFESADLQRNFSLGAVLSASFSMFFNRIGHFVPLALLCYVPVFIFLAVNQTDISEESSPLVTILESIIDILCSSIFAALATYEVVMNANGRRVTMGEAISAAMPRIVPVALTSILLGILIAIGAMLLIIPGLIVMTMLFVTIPIVVVERLGPGGSMSRSAALTKGNRWPIFGLVLIIWGVTIGMSQVFVHSFGLDMILAGNAVAFTVILTVFSIIMGVFNAIAVAHTYVYLKVSQEGANLNELADVFR